MFQSDANASGLSPTSDRVKVHKSSAFLLGLILTSARPSFLTSQSANVETTYPHPFTPKILSIFLEAWPVASALNFNLKPRAQPFLPYPPAQSFLFAKSSNQKWLPPLQDHQDTPGYRFSA